MTFELREQDLHGLRPETVYIQYVDRLQPFSARLSEYMLAHQHFSFCFVLSRSLKESSAFR